MQAFGNLLQGEQMRDQMAFAAGQQNQQLGLAQQQMAQEAELAQQRMAQGQQQFEAGLLENQRAREFATSERMAEQGFQAEQMAEARKWEQQKTNELRAFELELQELEIQAEEARAKGLTDLVREIEARKQATRVKRSQASTQLAQFQIAAGQTRKKAEQRMADFYTRLQQQISAEQASQTTGSQFGRVVVNGINTRAKDEAVANMSSLQSQQYGDTLGMSAKDIGAALTAAGLGDLPGAENLILDSDMFATLKSLSPGQTITASFVKGEKDPADMVAASDARMFSSLVEAAKGMGLKDESSAMDAFRLAVTGGDKAEISRKLVAAGLSPTAVKSMISNAAEQFDTTERERLRTLAAQYASEVGGQDDLRTRAVSSAMKALESQVSRLRSMAGRIDVAEMFELEAGLNMLGQRIKDGQLSGLTEAQLGRLSGGDVAQTKELLDALAENQSAADRAAAASVELGNIAESEAGDEGLDMLRMLLAQQAGTSERRKGLARIRGRLAP